MQIDVSCQPSETDLFSPTNIGKCQRYVRSIQRKLDLAVANGDKAKIRWYFHLLSKRSQAVKILAVTKVTKVNRGKYTAGVDGIALPVGCKTTQDGWRKQQLHQIDMYQKPQPIRRVFIPKPNGKQRPLGIPTMSMRIVGDVLARALEPIVEYHFNNQSYGFRPKRCTHDAAKDLFTKLSRKGSKRWVVEGDISGCFDHISHNHIVKTLQKWYVPKWATEVITKQLKSKIFYQGQAFANEQGTPQGSTLSPLLANVALTALDEFCLRFGWNSYNKEGRYTINPIVRYADDFVIVCQSELQAKFIKREVAQFLKRKIGLDLSEEKTKITHISKGFDFLGFHISKYPTKSVKPSRTQLETDSQSEPVESKAKSYRWENHKLLVTPQKEKVTRFVRDCKREIRSHRSSPPKAIINRLNGKLRGWGNYYRYVSSSSTYSKVDHQIWWKLFRWAKRRHPNKSKSWVINKYFSRVGNRKNVFCDKESQLPLFIMSRISCAKKWVKVNPQYRIFQSDKEAIEYWQKREYMNAKDAIVGSKTMSKLYSYQQGKCLYCLRQLTDKQIQNVEIDKHHQLPRSLGGNNRLGNLRLLHRQCHHELHARFSRKQMTEFTDSGIDYISHRYRL